MWLNKSSSITILILGSWLVKSSPVFPFFEEVVRMAKAYCPKCKRKLIQVLSSFECLSTWNKAEEYYAPGEDCKLVKRCPECGTLTKEREKKIERKVKKTVGEGGQFRKANSKANLAPQVPA
jgi:hypothetical protein